MQLKPFILCALAAIAYACTPTAKPEPKEIKTLSVITKEADDINANGATLYASFKDALRAPDEAGFEWGTEEGGISNSIKVESTPTGTSGEFSTPISRLSTGKSYVYRAYLVFKNEGVRKYHFGEIKSFTPVSDGRNSGDEDEDGGDGGNSGDEGEEGDGGNGDEGDEGDGGSGEDGPGSGEDGGDSGNVGGDPVVGNQAGYYELPVMNYKTISGGYLVDTTNPDYYYAYHKADVGSRNYTICYNGDYHCAMWVAAPRHAIYSAKNTNRSDAYKRDPKIPSNVQQSSKSTGSGYNKGHMLGSAERLGSRQLNEQVFYYTNIAPQNSSWFNTGGGGWNILEGFVDGFQCSDTLYVVIGTHFENFTDGYGNSASKKTANFMGANVQIPTAFYYALLRTKKGNSGKSLKNCSESEIMCAAFVRAHDQGTKGQKVTSREMMSISDLEKLTGFDFFPNVPNAPKDNFKPSDWGL